MHTCKHAQPRSQAATQLRRHKGTLVRTHACTHAHSLACSLSCTHISRTTRLLVLMHACLTHRTHSTAQRTQGHTHPRAHARSRVRVVQSCRAVLKVRICACVACVVCAHVCVACPSACVGTCTPCCDRTRSMARVIPRPAVLPRHAWNPVSDCARANDLVFSP